MSDFSHSFKPWEENFSKGVYLAGVEAIDGAKAPAGSYTRPHKEEIIKKAVLWDVVTVSCAFRHFENPQTFANESMRVLKKNGRVFMSEPFFSSVVRRLANTVVFPFSKTGDVSF